MLSSSRQTVKNLKKMPRKTSADVDVNRPVPRNSRESCTSKKVSPCHLDERKSALWTPERPKDHGVRLPKVEGSHCGEAHEHAPRAHLTPTEFGCSLGAHPRQSRRPLLHDEENRCMLMSPKAWCPAGGQTHRAPAIPTILTEPCLISKPKDPSQGPVEYR